MKIIVAVYNDWGIGANGSQPIILKADRQFFRAMTSGATVIVGRKTASDFPGNTPLPERTNILLTRSAKGIDGFISCRDPEEVIRLTQNVERVFVIGGGSVYQAMLPYCNVAYVTKIHKLPRSDTYFPNLDKSPEWKIDEIIQAGEENGIRYEFFRYIRV